ncbi:hypothetical protein KCP74_10130 [Salmonella enterica subsp. enterica]|nr:hypothetical protein KCP74_10130 [Salmonella enterica subsp. enterica]
MQETAMESGDAQQLSGSNGIKSSEYSEKKGAVLPSQTCVRIRHFGTFIYYLAVKVMPLADISSQHKKIPPAKNVGCKPLLSRQLKLIKSH